MGRCSGRVPDIHEMLAVYNSGKAETNNIDQWFLRDRVWPYIRKSCLVHDRCFNMKGSVRLPGPEPVGNQHIGQDEFSVRRIEQAHFIRTWIEHYPCLNVATDVTN
jgi:hypothetical protein